MGWIKLDDAFLDHPKFLAAGPLAGYLNIAAIAWSNRTRTDGWIPRSQVRRLVDFEGFGCDSLALADRLVSVGLWDAAPEGFRVVPGLHRNGPRYRTRPPARLLAAIAQRVAYYGELCWICRDAPYEALDHVKPVARGGSNLPANLRPACRSCNSAKGAQWPFPTRRRSS